MLRLVRGARAVCRVCCMWLHGWRRVPPGRWWRCYSVIDDRPMPKVTPVIAKAYIGATNATRWNGNSPRTIVVVGAVLEAWYIRKVQPPARFEYVVRYELKVLRRPNYVAPAFDFQEVFT